MIGFFLARQAEQAIGAHHNEQLRKHPPGPRKKPTGLGPLVMLEIVGFGVVFTVAGYNHDLAAIVPLFLIAPLVIGLSLLLTVLGRGTVREARMLPSKTALKRMKQVNLLLQPPCKVCGARPGDPCTPKPDKPAALLDAKWNTICHFPRMETAVRAGFVSRADVIAQWNGNVPEGLHL
jgi:hypothetical protein